MVILETVVKRHGKGPQSSAGQSRSPSAHYFVVSFGLEAQVGFFFSDILSMQPQISYN